MCGQPNYYEIPECVCSAQFKYIILKTNTQCSCSLQAIGHCLIFLTEKLKIFRTILYGNAWKIIVIIIVKVVRIRKVS